MSPNVPRILFVIGTMTACFPADATPQGRAASWLDDPKPSSWNMPGESIPAAPKGQGTVDPRCRAQARPAQLDEDMRVRKQGWDLVGAYQGGWQTVVIRATASYDGMCRPRQYQDFVFVRGIFAGTLAPRPMDSRTDGALGRVSLQSGRVTAEYVRYAASDPLCCPSRTTSVVFEIASGDRPVVRPVSSAAQSGDGSTAATSRPLEGTYWRAIELSGKPTPSQASRDEAHLQFQPNGRVSGADGCNQLSGSYERNGDRLTFGPMIGTQKACLTAAGTERPFRDALTNARRVVIAGERLELFDAAGTRVAVFAARAQASSASSSPSLSGTSWQLVKFEGGDNTVLTPDDRAKYTIEFGADGRVTARVDCNRGSGTWTSNGANQLRFGPLALTRAKCQAGSLHDQIVRQWENVRSYVVRDKRLFLSLMADGGIYEFEPIAAVK